MKLRFDQNVSPKLVGRLADLFPGSSHVQNESLDSAEDDAIWRFALSNGFAIVSKDVDYNNMSVVRGCPPKVVWLLTGNCSTQQLESIFRSRFPDITAFDQDPNAGTLALK